MIVGKIRCMAETLRKWVRRTERDQGLREGLTTSDLERPKILGRENRELKRANDMPTQGIGFFFQAELDRKPR